MRTRKQRRGILGLLVLALMWAPFASGQETRQDGVLGDFLSQILTLVLGEAPEVLPLPEEGPGPATEAGPNPPVSGLTGLPGKETGDRVVE